MGGYSGTYTGTFYGDDGKVDVIYAQKSDNSFSLIQKEYSGDRLIEVHFSGKFTMNKGETDVEKIDVDNALTKVYVNGKLTSSIDLEEDLKGYISEFFTLRFGKDYVVFGDTYILYKKGAKKLANNEVIKVLTEKESTELNKITKDSYDADFYILKNEEKPEEELQLGVLYSHFDACIWTGAKITKVEGLDTSKLGKQNVTITYNVDKLNLKDQTLKASIMVVESEKQLPSNLIEEIKVEIKEEESTYVELVQNGDLSSSSIVLKYCTKSGKSSFYTDWQKLELTSETLEEFRIEGLDNTKLGFQEVTITHIETGVSAKLTVNVIDPKTPVEIKTSGRVKIKADKTFDLSEAKYTITYVDGSKSDEIALAETDMILQGSIADYVDGDDMVFKVSVKVGNKTLVYYSTISVVVETA